MSVNIKLSSKLPGDPEINGLDSLADELQADPSQIICAIAWLDVKTITHDVESGADLPTVRIRRIEPIGTLDKVPQAIIRLASELEEKRTGRKPLPFDALSSDESYAELVYQTEAVES